MSRALNRHHAQRLRKRRASYYTTGGQSDDPRAVGIAARTPKPCSCWMCRNKRQDEGPALEERRNTLAPAEGEIC